MYDTLAELSKHLKNYYGKECIVLIDEYDHPLNVAYRFNITKRLVVFLLLFLEGSLRQALVLESRLSL
jgi:hypothetical protein